VLYANDDVRDFSLSGALDGREYPADRSYGPGRLRLERRGDNMIQTVYTSDTGLYVETSRILLSADGRRMTRFMEVVTPERREQWVEVYERKPNAEQR
jgi:hypothetical protein